MADEIDRFHTAPSRSSRCAHSNRTEKCCRSHLHGAVDHPDGGPDAPMARALAHWEFAPRFAVSPGTTARSGQGFSGVPPGRLAIPDVRRGTLRTSIG